MTMQNIFRTKFSKQAREAEKKLEGQPTKMSQTFQPTTAAVT